MSTSNPYTFHGLEVLEEKNSPKGKQGRCDCPFCGKEGHFFFNYHNIQHNCRRCGTSGNQFTFFQQLYLQAYESTTKQDYQQLSEERNLDPRALTYTGFAHNPLNDSWLIPGFNDKRKLVNLYKVIKFTRGKDKGKYRILSAPGCTQQLFLSNRLRPDISTIYILEGHWDTVAFYQLLTTHRTKGSRLVKTRSPEESLYSSRDVVGLPGATTFPADWLTYLKGKTCYFIYDDDEGGEQGKQHLQKLLEKNGNPAKAVHLLNWQQALSL